MLGRTLGHYRILESLGAGGMGEVYVAEDTTLERRVALKVLPPELAASRERLDRFEREAKALATLDHPNIVAVYSVESDEGVPFLTMQLVDGQPLSALISDGGLPLDQLLDLAIPLADALAEAHERGIVHRDLKPANIMVDVRGRPKILDFGLAKLELSEAEDVSSQLSTGLMTQEGRVLGTYPYMSPEQAEGKPVDHRSDLFSFGSVLYEMATGVRPFTGDSPASLLGAILKDEAAPLADHRDDLPESLSQILDRCLEKDPEDRYPSAGELGAELAALKAALDSGTALEIAGRAKLPAFLTEKSEETPPPLFVGRDEELATLDGFLSEALTGNGRVAFITGEAGTGKTALVQAFVRRALQEHENLVAASGGCSAHTGPGDPYAPVRQVLSLVTGDVEAHWRSRAITSEQATRLWSLLPRAATALVDSGVDLVGTLLVAESLLKRAEVAAGRGAQWLTLLRTLVERKLSLPPDVMLQQKALFGQTTRLLQDLAQEAPILLVLEDLHWTDTGSADLLAHLGRPLAGHRILVLGTFRPSEVRAGRGDERHPLEPVLHDLERTFGQCQVHLHQGDEAAFVDELVDAEPNRLGREFRNTLYSRTQGHALFTVELLRDMQERGMLVKDDGTWVEGPELDWDALPAQVEGVIGERIGRLTSDLRELLKVASVEGESFTAEVLARIQKAETRDTVRLLSQELERGHRLVTAEGLQRVNAGRLSLYRFLHVLFQKYLYDELDEAERAYLHEDVGTALEELWGKETAEIAGQLARHFEEAGITEKAVQYYAAAGQRAVRMAANREAIEHYRTALSLLATLPPSAQRDETELGLQLALNAPLTMTTGWSAPEIRSGSSRALELTERLGNHPLVPLAHFFLSVYSSAVGKTTAAIHHSDTMIELAEAQREQTGAMVGRLLSGCYNGFAGQLVRARDRLETVDAWCRRESPTGLTSIYGIEPVVASKVHLGWVLAYLGYLDQSRANNRESIALARELGHPQNLSFALGGAAIADWRRRDWEMMRRHANESLVLTSETGWAAIQVPGYCFKGLTLAVAGEIEQGTALIEQGIALLESIGSRLNLPMFLETLAAVYAMAGRFDEAQSTLDESLHVAPDIGEYKFEMASATKKGELYAKAGDDNLAEEWLLKGIELAREREGKLIELEASATLARVWQGQGKQGEALELLGPIYAWFTEGFDELPLVEAKSVLDELRSEVGRP